MTGITAEACELGGIFAESYELEFYQRGYRWTKEHVNELLDDLVTTFRDDYKRTDNQKATWKYQECYLGAIVTTQHQRVRELVDGQQRLTTLILLLIYLARRLEQAGEKADAERLTEKVRTRKGGEDIYKLRAHHRDADHHKRAFDYIRTGCEGTEGTERNDSEQNIIARHHDIVQYWDENQIEMDDHEVTLFAEWVLERVTVVKIVSTNRDSGFSIFETMNDRGLALRPTEMLRGLLLDRLPYEERNDQRYLWDESIRKPKEWPPSQKRDYAEECVRTWIRARYSRSEEDYKGIGNKVHHWFRKELESTQEFSSLEIRRLIDTDFAFYSDQYHKIWRASHRYDRNEAHAYFNGSLDLTSLQAALVLAGLTPKMNGSDGKIQERVTAITQFLEIFVAQRIWAGQAVAHRTMVSNVSQWIPRIRAAEDKVGETLCALLEEAGGTEEPFSGICRLTPGTRQKIRAMLARMTEHVEISAGRTTARYDDLLKRGQKGFEIEHLIPNKPDGQLRKLEAKSVGEFEDTRNRIGGLILLPTSKNRTLGALQYEERRASYRDENKLAASLLEGNGKEDAAMRRMREKFGLRPEEVLNIGMLERREAGYREIAKDVWSPEPLERVK